MSKFVLANMKLPQRGGEGQGPRGGGKSGRLERIDYVRNQEDTGARTRGQEDGAVVLRGKGQGTGPDNKIQKSLAIKYKHISFYGGEG